MNTAYTENAEKYEWLMNNFDSVFSPIIDTKNENGAFVNKTTNKLVGYTMNWDYIKANTPIKKTINVRDEFFLNIENLAKSNSADIFNYEGIIFDNKTFEYKSEIKPKLDEINVLINQEREKIQKLEKNIETPNVLHIMSLIISLFVGIIIVSIIIIKILQDKKIDKKLNSKGINKKRYIKK